MAPFLVWFAVFAIAWAALFYRAGQRVAARPVDPRAIALVQQAERRARMAERSAAEITARAARHLESAAADLAQAKADQAAWADLAIELSNRPQVSGRHRVTTREGITA
jgi:cell division septum initiation protein DivIVA